MRASFGSVFGTWTPAWSGRNRFWFVARSLLGPVSFALNINTLYIHSSLYVI